MLEQNIDSDIEADQNEIYIDLYVEDADNTADTNRIVPESFISKLNKKSSSVINGVWKIRFHSLSQSKMIFRNTIVI